VQGEQPRELRLGGENRTRKVEKVNKRQENGKAEIVTLKLLGVQEKRKKGLPKVPPTRRHQNPGRMRQQMSLRGASEEKRKKGSCPRGLRKAGPLRKMHRDEGDRLVQR